ncbi:hypothetical protein [Histidinibacterium aquaticum]|uniref:DUF4177 domain-containing protein n=1 Tax=Histidinibacterium aquaticum TaxID=2613962 RepID=A0A5J5GCT1_9RHOB|nr:hypothetical protein [Histidinibacterium aquaticum]KAA9005965.1 hypothetical protein F3S47_15520 [Histidinibacterium aquaticum]
MTRILLALAILTLTALPAAAECFADYKAKRDDPLRLHYGVAEIEGSCSVDNASEQLNDRLSEAGWQLLEVLDTFDEDGADSRRDDAGNNYLRY